MNLSTIEMPSYFLNIATSFSTEVKNNIWMENMSEEDLSVDIELALAQWTDLYNVLSANGLVTIMPTPYNCKLQDLCFIANLGVIINNDTIIISNFTSEARIGESEVGLNYFKLAGYKNVIMCPFKFEGSADMKNIKNNIWIGGYGIRTDIRAYEWMEKQFGLEIIKVKMTNEKCYHLDCQIFIINKDIVMACEELLTKSELKEIRKYAEIVNVPLHLAECGICNNIRLHNFILNSSDIYDLDPVLDEKDYKLEKEKNDFLEEICISYGMEPIFVNLSSFTSGGAMLSCLVLEANRFSYSIDLV